MLATALVAMAGLLALASTASAWAPASSAAIHPGVQTLTDGGQCTANFIFSDGTNTYIGQAAHCSGTDGNTATNGCVAHSLPTGTPVEVGGASWSVLRTPNPRPWRSMNALPESPGMPGVTV